MNKYFLLIVLLLISGVVAAQKKGTPLHVIKSDSSITIQKISLTRVYKAVFQQDNTILSSDSAYFHTQANTIEAFGHVIITQGDTLHVFGDKLDYDGKTKIAIMTNNVRLIDKDATLTTNYFVYNTATKYGTYTGGGKLVNKENTLVSKNGYYFASSRDAYFRYNVVLNTTDAIIKTDTLRYNSETRIAYFYGPTNIYGKKDNDTLYTENGTYNTQTELAVFGKNNLWKQKTKSLKGDSLIYDRLAGYGRAIKHVTFADSEQKIILKGGLGEHFKEGERTLMTQHPYVIFVTEEKDTTKTDLPKKDTLSANVKTAIVKNAVLLPPKNSIPVKNVEQLKADAFKTDLAKAKPVIDAAKAKANALLPKDAAKAIPILKTDSVPKTDTTKRIKRDSIFMTADTIETQIMTYGDIMKLKEDRRLAALRDTTIKTKSAGYFDPKKPIKHLDAMVLRIPTDTTIFHRDYFKRAAVAKDTTHRKPEIAVVKKPVKIPPLKKIVTTIDSVNLTQDVVLKDTARVRILVAAHHAKIFKSDLQAKADSIFFSYGDSVARMYYKPMIWAQGSQLSADTINLQLKHKQVDNLLMAPSAFIVNIEKRDSVHFNQVGGKKMRGFFKDGKLQRVYVFANAETIYFMRDSIGKVTEMHRTISSKIRVTFRKNEPIDIMQYVKPEEKHLSINIVKEDDKVLRGFLWKPKDRPVSKEAITGPPEDITSKKTPVKTTPKKIAGTKPFVKADAPAVLKPVVKPVTDSIKVKSDTTQHIKVKPDTTKVKSK